jgi:putative oxidoreductase
MKMPGIFADEKMIELSFRMLFSLIFIVAGFQHIFGLDKVLLRFGATPWAPILNSIVPGGALILMTGVILLVGGVALLFGSFTRVAALLLISVLIPITLTVQQGGGETLGPLFKNIALMGGLIHFAASGAGHWSLDRLRMQGRKLPLYFSGAKFLLALMVVGLMLPTALQLPLMAKTKTEAVKNAQNLAILVREPRHLEVALTTATEGMHGKDGLTLKRVSIVVCGKAGVMGLKKGSSSETLISEAADRGIHVIACGLSLKEAGMIAEDLSSRVSVVENGLWEMIRLQSEGAISIEL